MNHVAFVLPGIDRVAGAERQAIALAKGLAARDWRVSFVALSGTGGELAPQLEAANVPFLSLGMRHGLADPRGWLRLHLWLRRERPDVVHAHLPHASWMARASRVFAPVRVVVDTLHTSALVPWHGRLFYRMTARLSDCVTAVSPSVAHIQTATEVARPEQVIVIANGLDIDEWRPDAAERSRMRAALGLDREFLWCAAGRLEPVKDYSTLLRAFAMLPRSARLVIAGEGSQKSMLRSLAGELGVSHRVQFLGYQPDIRPWMQAADAFVLSSLWEGLPLCLLEAAACALPCVATNVPGSRDIIVDGQTGYLARPGNAGSLSRSMLRVMYARPENRASMGRDSLQNIVEQFSLQDILDRWQQLYRILLESNRRPRRLATAFMPLQLTPFVERAAASESDVPSMPGALEAEPRR